MIQALGSLLATHAPYQWLPSKGKRAAWSRAKRRLWKTKPPRSLARVQCEERSLAQANLDPGHPEEDRLKAQNLLQHEVGSMTLLVIVRLTATRENVLLGNF